MKKRIVSLALASVSIIASTAPANAALFIDSISAANSGAPTASLTAFNNNYGTVKVSPFNITGTLNGDAVSLFSYCVDVFNTIGTGKFKVVSLNDYVFGNTVKADRIAALISNQGAPGTAEHDAAVQLALWELLYEKNGTDADLTDNRFKVPTISDPSVRALAQNYAELARTSWTASDNIVISVAKNKKRQNQLFWTHIPAVPEPGTWAMMIMGFGVTGAAMRRRRTKTQVKVSFA